MAQRDRNASLAGLAALGALMYARSRKQEGGGDEEAKPVRTTTRADDGFKTLEDAPQSEKGAMAPAAPTPAVAKPAPAKPAAPMSAGAGRGGQGGPSAVQMAQAAMGAGGGRGGQGGPSAAELAAYQRPAERSDVRKFEQEAERKALEARQKRLATPGVDAVEPDVDVMSPFPGASKFLQATGKGLANVMRGREAMAQAAQAGAKRLGEGQKMLESPGVLKQRGLDAARAERAAERKVETPDVINMPGKNAGMTAQDRMREMKMGRYRDDFDMPLKKGGKAKVKKMATGGMAKSSAASRGDGIAKRGKTRGKMY